MESAKMWKVFIHSVGLYYLWLQNPLTIEYLFVTEYDSISVAFAGFQTIY